MTGLDARSVTTLDAGIAVPSYGRDDVTVGIVHIGVGGFHRAHQALFLDRLMNAGTARDWGICGVGVLPADRRMKEVLGAQDGLYTLVEKHADGRLDARVVGSIVEYLLAADDAEAIVERMADRAVRIISLTITEGGYHLDADGRFDASDDDLVRDVRGGAGPPTTAFGLVTEALARRRDRDAGPVTIMSCDNIAGNGPMAREVFTTCARLREDALGDWVEAHVRFPSSMVDRITPQTTDEDRAAVAGLGVEDGWPVVCEPFLQWVLEDDFAAGRPPFEEVGVQVVDDVEPYEMMKLRLLNAGHQGVAYLGYLAGYRLVHEAAADPAMAAFLLGYMRREGVPTLPDVPGTDLGAYTAELIARFANPQVRDTVARLAAYSSDRIPTWLLPVVRHNLAHDGEIERSAAIVAAWARYAEGVDEDGEPIDVVDLRREAVLASAARQREDPTAFLADRSLFGDLVDDGRFVAAYREALDALHTRGARAVLDDLGDPPR